MSNDTQSADETYRRAVAAAKVTRPPVDGSWEETMWLRGFEAAALICDAKMDSMRAQSEAEATA